MPSRCITRLLRVFLLVAAALAGALPAQAQDYGKQGDPIRLRVVYLPYHAATWSGAVLRSKKFYEKYLPRGSTVEFAAALTGDKAGAQLRSGEQHIGYVPDSAVVAGLVHGSRSNVRLVAVLGLSRDTCSTLLVRSDAPTFATSEKMLEWLKDKRLEAPSGGCFDRYAQALIRRGTLAPASYEHNNIEVVTSGFRAKQVDAASLPEPAATRLVNEGVARRVPSGNPTNQQEAAFVAMRAELLERRPDVAEAWLKAELDAQLFLADQRNAPEVIKILGEQTAGFGERDLWGALYGGQQEGDSERKMSLPFAFTDQVMEMVSQLAPRAAGGGATAQRQIAVVREKAQALLDQRQLSSPLGEIRAIAAAPGAMGRGATRGELSIKVTGSGWAGNTREIEDVLMLVGQELMSKFPGRMLAPIVVSRSSRTPVTHYEKGPGGEYRVELTADGSQPGPIVYEFAHEFCHVLSNYDRHPHHAVTRNHQWFEEALCEVSSLYTLKTLGTRWARTPPKPHLAAQASELLRIEEKLRLETHRRLPRGTTLAKWFKDNQEGLRRSPYDRNRNEVVANLMLPLFEESPELWEAIGFLNLDAPGVSFQDYLANWHDNCPQRYSDVIRYAMTLFFGEAGMQAKYPSRPIEIIVTFGREGGSDTMARKMAELLSPILGVQVLVSNVRGAAGNAGLMKALSSSDPDHTLTTLTAISVATWSTGVGAIRPEDFAPLALVQDAASMLFVAKDSPFATIGDLLAHAKTPSGRVRIATIGYNTPDDLMVSALASAGYRVANAPYADSVERIEAGASQAVDALYEQPGDVAKYLESGKLRPLVVFSAQRHAQFPDVPTAREAGLAVEDVQTFRTLAMPARTPPERQKVIADAIAKVLATPDWREFCEQTYSCSAKTSRADAAARIKGLYESTALAQR